MKKEMAMILMVISMLLGLSLFWVKIPGQEESRLKSTSQKHVAERAQAVSSATDNKAEGRADQQGANQKNRDQSNDRIAENAKKIALTFDDGPHPFYTDQLLDGLKEREVRVTFFVTGEHAALHPDVIRRMREEGHLIGNHTYSHTQLRSDNRETFKEELIKTNAVIEEITGKEVEYVRPPYGSWDKSFEQELNMFPVLWTVDPLDWCSQNTSCITDRIIGHVKENDIILMHDYYETSVTAALQVVDELQAQGYTFVTVDEILFD